MKLKEDTITIAEGLGFFGYFLGGFLMFIGIVLLFIEMYITGFAFLIPGLFLATFRQRLTVDKKNETIIKNWGLFAAYLKSKKLSTKEVKAIVIYHQVTKDAGYAARKSHTYRMEIECQDRTVDIWSWPIDDDAYKAADAIAKLLNVSRYTRTNK
jgi:hypothetical protein